MELPTTSVVIPTHNRPEKALQAIESVENQTESPEELIVVNDGSTASYDRVKYHLDESPHTTTYLETSGLGAPAARNTGAAEASGDVLMFLDDDDRWRPLKIERQLRYFNESEKIVLVYSGRVAVDESGEVQYSISGGAKGDLSEKIFLDNYIGTTSGPAMRRDVFEEVGGFDTEIPGIQDWDLWVRICQHGLVAYDPSTTVEWTVHDDPGEQMSGEYLRYVQATERFMQKYASEIKELPWYMRRKARARQAKSVAASAAVSGSRAKYKYALQSLLLWPTLPAAVQLAPRSLYLRARQLYTNVRGNLSNS